MLKSCNERRPAPCLGADSPSVSELRRRLAQTPSMRTWLKRLTLAAEHDVLILLTGETGTGKTWLARLLHDCSPRRDEPFVTVPCGALPAPLVESELFGHVRGAFTGADRSRAGKIAAAGRGTLLLDEIDTLGLEQQAKLLRVLDSGEYEPVGSNETRQQDCRIVAASNVELSALIERGAFRADLYYRLDVLPFYLPPLRERIEDIEPLARRLTARYAAQFGRDLLDVHPEALAALESYSWPGNIRELDNALRQAVLLSCGPSLLKRHLPERIWKRPATAKLFAPSAARSLAVERAAVECNLIRRALAVPGRNRTGAARELGISRVTLHKKMKKYGLALA